MAGVTYTSKSGFLSSNDNRLGLNSTASPISLQDGEASDLQNIDFDKFGGFSKRNGYTALNTTAFNAGATWTSLHFLELSTGVDYIMGTCGNKLAKMDSFDGTWDDITGALTITAGNNNLFDWITFLDIAYGTNNVDVPIKWTGAGNGSAMTVPATLTKAKFVTKFAGRLFLANVELAGVTYPTRLYWSSINAETWNAADFNSVDLNDGQAISGLEVLGDRLVIFKERSIHIAVHTGDADIPFTFTKTSSPVGAVSGYNIAEIDNGLMFSYIDGYWYFDGWNAFKASDRINTTYDGLAQARYEFSNGAYQKIKNRYWASVTASGGSTNNRNITWDSFNNSFSVYKGINSNCMVVLNTSGDERIYFGDYLGFVYLADTGSNDNPSNVSTAIDGYYWTRWFHDSDLVNVKGNPRFVLYYDYASTTLRISYSYDLSNAEDFTIIYNLTAPGEAWDTAIWDTALWGASGGSFRRIDLDGRGRLVRFKFSNAILSQPFKINGFGREVYLETIV